LFYYFCLYMSIAELYDLYSKHPSITTDTRQLKAGDIYFALKGPNFNGNQLALKALEQGASFAVIDETLNTDDKRIIQTNDSLVTLQQLAKHHREHFNIPFLAITGSNGKTTTKELIHAVLSQVHKTYTTSGNLNNHIGIPLTLLKVKRDAAIAVIEMGANHIGEIASYCEYAQPTHGLITNIGKAHLEGFGSVEGVKRGKGELFEYLKKTDGIAFINHDDVAIVDMSKWIRQTITYGCKEANITGRAIANNSFLSVAVKYEQEDYIINTKLVGNYNLNNILAAVAVANFFGVSKEQIKRALENYEPSNSRSQLIVKDTNKIILDAYNANPSSMRAAIENFAAMEGDNKVLMLGSMAELGTDSQLEHEQVISLINKYQWKEVVLVGKEFNKISHQYTGLADSAEGQDWLKSKKLQNTSILIKGSRSMQMEKVLE
jgi:UDP-N-acetylmuramoyl-tripeptide--D-alanyl-D-alanine ligase